MNQMKENKVVRYDRDKKKVILKLTQEGEINDGQEVLGKTENVFNQEYEVSGIKKIWAKLQEDKQRFEHDLKQLKNKLDYELIVFENEAEIEEFKKKLEELKKYDEKQKAESQIKQLEEMIKSLKTDILKLEPIIKKLPK
tara:strand:- start:1313 stop:1732 length:420 start_codon:yes stop_codon:yes gene_type:complete